MTRPTIAAIEVIDNDSLAVQRLIRCLCPFGPTRILAQLVLIDSVWIPDAGTPTPRTAWTIAPTRRFAADSAGADVAAKRVTDSESDATFGVSITDPWPATVSVAGVEVSAERRRREAQRDQTDQRRSSDIHNRPPSFGSQSPPSIRPGIAGVTRRCSRSCCALWAWGGRHRVNPPVPSEVPRLVSLLVGPVIAFVIGDL